MSSTKSEGQPASGRVIASEQPLASRDDRSWAAFPIDGLESLLLSLIAVSAAALLFGIFLALRGHDPLAVYRTLYLGAFGTRFSLETTLTQAAPLLLTALCTLIPARVGLLVIGAEGAVVLGGIGAVLAGTVALGPRSIVGTAAVGCVVGAGVQSGFDCGGIGVEETGVVVGGRVEFYVAIEEFDRGFSLGIEIDATLDR